MLIIIIQYLKNKRYYILENNSMATKSKMFPFVFPFLFKNQHLNVFELNILHFRIFRRSCVIFLNAALSIIYSVRRLRVRAVAW